MDELITGAAKLALKEVPVKVALNKYQIRDLAKKALELERALKDGETVAVPRRALSIWSKIRSLVTRDKRRLGIVQRPVLEQAARKALDEIKARMETLAAENLEGVLTPLTNGDKAEADAYWYVIRRQVSAAIEQQRTEDGERIRQEAIDYTCNTHWFAKHVQVALKRRNAAGQFERALTVEEALRIDPRIMQEVWIMYHEAFVLSEEEIKKSSAPKKAV